MLCELGQLFDAGCRIAGQLPSNLDFELCFTGHVCGHVCGKPPYPTLLALTA